MFSEEFNLISSEEQIFELSYFYSRAKTSSLVFNSDNELKETFQISSAMFDCGLFNMFFIVLSSHLEDISVVISKITVNSMFQRHTNYPMKRNIK